MIIETTKADKTTDSYAGGAKSGMAVENPDDINGVIEKAEQNSKKNKESGQDREKPDVEIRITLY